MAFTELGLSDKVLQAVEASGYTQPTPIQEQAIPHVLARRDVLGIAQTGTGKTAAFTLPMLTLLETGRARARMPRTLILEPTRELAAQVEDSFVKYGANHRLNVALIIGGVSFGDQDAKLTRGVDVLIATPGRLLDHFERGKLLLSGIEVLVIDEADRMLDMGFIPDIERICKMVPFTRQTLFFSATMPPEIQRLVDNFLSNPARVEVARASSTASTITQRAVASGAEAYEKRETLRRLIRGAEELKNGIIFCNRKSDVALVQRSLERHGFSVVALHGDMDQRSRMQALDKFRTNEVQLLVASDVAARGLDIPDVSHVFNYDVPHHPEDYVHRIGRTGRAGRSGTALMIVTPADDRSIDAIAKLTSQTLEWDGPSLAELDLPAARSDGRRGGRRSGGKAEFGKTDSSRGERGERDRGGRRDERARDDRGRRSDTPDAGRERRRDDASDFPPLAAQPYEAPRRDRSGDRRDRRRDDEASPIGFGDHMPAFIARPVRMPKPTVDEPATEEPLAQPAKSDKAGRPEKAEVKAAEGKVSESKKPEGEKAEGKPASQKRKATRSKGKSKSRAATAAADAEAPQTELSQGLGQDDVVLGDDAQHGGVQDGAPQVGGSQDKPVSAENETDGMPPSAPNEPAAEAAPPHVVAQDQPELAPPESSASETSASPATSQSAPLA